MQEVEMLTIIDTRIHIASNELHMTFTPNAQVGYDTARHKPFSGHSVKKASCSSLIHGPQILGPQYPCPWSLVPVSLVLVHCYTVPFKLNSALLIVDIFLEIFRLCWSMSFSYNIVEYLWLYITISFDSVPFISLHGSRIMKEPMEQLVFESLPCKYVYIYT